MKMRKLFSLILVLSLVFTVAACSGGNNNDGNAPEPAPAKTDGNSKTGDKDKEPPKEEPEETYDISGITYIFGNPAPKDGRGAKMLNEKFNVNYYAEKIPNDQFVEVLTARVAGGDLPDMVSFRAANNNLFVKWANQGAFLPLNDFIDDYPSLKDIPDEQWLPFTIDGKIYGIPTWSPTEANSFMVRKDWLDNLGLGVPTSYEELKEAAIAFTKDDPDKNGEQDTYGIAIGQNINPDFAMGPYWQHNTWYHRDADGNYLPGIITEGRKELISFFHDLHAEKAMTPDFAVLNWADTNKEFYSGKAGVFLVAPRGMSQAYMESLLEIDPEAEFVVLPPFKAADGSQGFTAGNGYGRFLSLNANLEGQEGKIRKILEIHEFARQYYPSSEQGPQNEDFDWYYGNEGTGYKMEDGKRVPLTEPGSGTEPFLYFLDSTPWVKSDQDPEFAMAYTEPKLVDVTEQLVKINEEYPLYFQPTVGVISETEGKLGAELQQFLMNEQTKMIAGNRPISDWDAMVHEYLSRGGQQIIDEYNEQIQARGYTDPVWK